MASLTLYIYRIYILPPPQCTCAEFSSFYSGNRVAIEWLSSGYRVAIEWLPSGMGVSLLPHSTPRGRVRPKAKNKELYYGLVMVPYVVMITNGFTS